MMQVRIATAPGSWGVEAASDPSNPPWEAVLDDVADAGYEGVELGPFGYLPGDPQRLRDELARRGLALASGYVMEPFHDRRESARIVELATRTCALVAAVGARHVVLIAALVPERSNTAGRQSAAPRLDEAGWAAQLTTVSRVARLATEEHGLTAVFHPHAGTYVEFADETARLPEETDPVLLKLCVDTGHSIYAGVDPVDLIVCSGDRVGYLHLKDVRRVALERALAAGLTFEQVVAGGVFCSLGQGTVNFTRVRRALQETGYAGWATVEQDRLPDDPAARSDAEESLRHLRERGVEAVPELSSERSAS